MALSKRNKWWFNGSVGAVLFGSGLSLATAASHWKHDGKDWKHWGIGGTTGIGLALSGVVLLSRAGVLKREMEKEKGKIKS